MNNTIILTIVIVVIVAYLLYNKQYNDNTHINTKLMQNNTIHNINSEAVKEYNIPPVFENWNHER
jgi:hypothetical protein